MDTHFEFFTIEWIDPLIQHIQACVWKFTYKQDHRVICTRKLQLKMNCGGNFELLCQLLAEPAQIFYPKVHFQLKLMCKYMITAIDVHSTFINYVDWLCRKKVGFHECSRENEYFFKNLIERLYTLPISKNSL